MTDQASEFMLAHLTAFCILQNSHKNEHIFCYSAQIGLNLFGFVCAHTCAHANGMKIVYSGDAQCSTGEKPLVKSWDIFVLQFRNM